MWRILICNLLLIPFVIVTAQSKEEMNTDQPLLTTQTVPQEAVTSEQNSVKPIPNENEEKPDFISFPQQLIQNDEPTIPNRRFITYDQRQEGQYNIRADLENFMIVLVPQTPTEGLSILDLLTKSAYKGNSFNKPKIQNNQYRPKFKPQFNPTQQHFNFINKQPSISLLDGNQRKISGIIEGRTPYKVDLSSESDLSQIHSQQPVDVLPPPYPFAYQLLKPYHLDAEPNVVQAVKHRHGNDKRDRILNTVKFDYNSGDNVRISKTLNDPSKYIHDGFEVLPKTIDLKLEQEENRENEYENSVVNIDKPIWELKLIGSTENCGPERYRDSYGICRFLHTNNF